MTKVSRAGSGPRVSPRTMLIECERSISAWAIGMGELASTAINPNPTITAVQPEAMGLGPFAAASRMVARLLIPRIHHK
jgi:hypothetical protein